MSAPLPRLDTPQRAAVDPQECVWLSASAGTGKTQVLSARVLRLLLQRDVHPSSILCLTFTKAGAAEMADRVNAVLAGWARMDDVMLGKDLAAIGAEVDAQTRLRARSLFASVLDCPGGGLRIDTIHAFSQWLLATFPEEAGILPGFRAMEDRERELLSRDVLTELLIRAEREQHAPTLATLEAISRDKGPDAVRQWLMRCASADIWEGPGGWQSPMRPRLCRLLGLAENAGKADLAALCSDEQFDVASLRACLAAQAAWKAKTGQETAAGIRDWLDQDPAGRAAGLEGLYKTMFTGKDTVRSLKKMQGIDPAYEDYAERVRESLSRVQQLAQLIQLADAIPPQLELGRKFALMWAEAKQREALVDFDDQIRQAAQLLARPDVAPWIRYKLDRQFDHVLIDEAQDTNREQWDIIFALIDDFFAGEGAHDGALRTVFTVGDYKQAIFRFQGTSPENFEAARRRVKSAMDAAADNAERLKANHPVRRLRDLDLARSFRTSQPVLDFVDAAIERIGPAQLGLKEAAEPHLGRAGPGLVTLWQPVRADSAEGDEEEEAESEVEAEAEEHSPDRAEDGDGAETWLASHDRVLADRIARQVKRWLDEGYPLAKHGRNAVPGDIMVLVRKRRDLAGLIVARLFAAGVPVAGVDRLRIGAPLVVKDLMAALRFAAQPLDDLNLASLLASPLIGWSQEDLLAHACRADHVRLWDHLRSLGAPLVERTLESLRALLARADFEPPQALLHWILTGPWQGRRRLVARLGPEANDPVNELLNAAHAYASAHPASLQGFIQWFDAGTGELKREADGGGGLVRVMTVHGSKGLQSPIVILADATGKPDLRDSLALEEALPGQDRPHKVPLPDLRKEQKVGPIAALEERTARDMLEEHWRLLYVAMTRAEEALFIGGALGKKDKEPHEASWYAALAPLFGEAFADDEWGARQEWGARAAVRSSRGQAGEVHGAPLPDWALRPVGPEPRPPRPLAPSSAGDDPSPDPPLPAGVLADAARRGVLLHGLLERLPALAEAEREAGADRWLARQAGDLDDSLRAGMRDQALAVLRDPRWAELFGPGSLAEVPLAAVVGGQVIAGTVDRLLVQADQVLVVDYKTARQPPAMLKQIPATTLRQMAAYQAALAVIYPGRAVRMAVLYTQTPQLFELPDTVLAPHKAALQALQ